MKKQFQTLPLVCSLLIIATSNFTSISAQNVPAFPGAEGYGAATRGGRGGEVIAVTNLSDSGPGSLRAAVESVGPRMIVFKVAGTIESNLRIKNDFITIAGQSAPGDGICIKGSITVDANEVIIRYIRIRPDPRNETDAIWGRYRKNIIVDHVSASWSSDEVMSLYHNEYVTLQWCMISEACAKGDSGHRFGGIWGNNYGTYHHNLIAHNDSRNPRWASGCGYNDYRNNVLYNWGYQSCYGGEAQQRGDRRNPPIEHSTINLVANYYKAGPATGDKVKKRIAEPSSRGNEDKGNWYVRGNSMQGFPEVTADNWLGVDGAEYIKMSEPWDAMSIQQDTPEVAYQSVLNHAGCSFPQRDSLDLRIISEVRDGTATYGRNGIITTPDDVGGWPELAEGTVPSDSDDDGMPDAWEKKFGLNVDNDRDASLDKDSDGFTNLEEYLNATDPTKFIDYSKPENNVNTLNSIR